MYGKNLQQWTSIVCLTDQLLPPPQNVSPFRGMAQATCTGNLHWQPRTLIICLTNQLPPTPLLHSGIAQPTQFLVGYRSQVYIITFSHRKFSEDAAVSRALNRFTAINAIYTAPPHCPTNEEDGISTARGRSIGPSDDYRSVRNIMNRLTAVAALCSSPAAADPDPLHCPTNEDGSSAVPGMSTSTPRFL